MTRRKTPRDLRSEYEAVEAQKIDPFNRLNGTHQSIRPTPAMPTPTSSADANGFDVVSAADVHEVATVWLAPGRLSMSNVWFLDGVKGSGKSSIAASVPCPARNEGLVGNPTLQMVFCT